MSTIAQAPLGRVDGAAAAGRVPRMSSISFACVVLLIAMLPFGTTEVPGVSLELADLAVAAVAVGLVVDGFLDNRRVLRWAWPLGALAVILVFAMLAVPGASDPGVALRVTGRYILGVLLVTALLAAVPTLGALWRVVAVLVAMGAGVAVHTLLVAGPVAASGSAAVLEGRATGVFNDPNFLGSFAAMMLCVALAMLITAGRPALRILAGAAVAVLVGALALSMSRGAWIGAFVGVIMVLWTARSRRRQLVLGGLGSVGVAAAALSLAPGGVSALLLGRLQTLGATTNDPREGRPAIYQFAFSEVARQPLVGIGPGNFGLDSSNNTAYADPVYAVHAHNTLLTVAVEAGVMASLALAAFGLALALMAWRRFRELRRSGMQIDAIRLSGVLAALGAFAVHGLFDYTLINPIISALAWTLLGFVMVGLTAPFTSGEVREQHVSVRVPTHAGRDAVREARGLGAVVAGPAGRDGPPGRDRAPARVGTAV